MQIRILILAVALFVAALACSKKLNPGFCNANSDCANGYRCDSGSSQPGTCVCDSAMCSDGGMEGGTEGGTEGGQDVVSCGAVSCGGSTPICDDVTHACRVCVNGSECAARDQSTPACSGGACVECGTSGDCALATKPVCDSTSKVCRACSSGSECGARDSMTPACASSGICVECVTSIDCTTAAKPVCNAAANTCRACKADSECPADPGICMTDGHCATAGEVVFVESNASGCPGADGSSANPFCAPNSAVTALTTTRHVIVIRGATSNQMMLSTTGLSPVVIGRKNSSGVEGSIPATSLTAITVSSDNVLIRDLTVNLGSTSASKGIVASGASTKVTLLRVTVSLGTGLGVDAESGARLVMDECYLQNNSVGGVLINGASYDLANSVFATNGYGVKFNAATVSLGSQFWFNTVTGSVGSAVTCDSTNPQTLTASIVLGLDDSCTLSNSLTTGPTFDTARPYHLTGRAACPSVPATFPDHDIDGDLRAAPIDCGADQYVP